MMETASAKRIGRGTVAAQLRLGLETKAPPGRRGQLDEESVGGNDPSFGVERRFRGRLWPEAQILLSGGKR